MVFLDVPFFVPFFRYRYVLEMGEDAQEGGRDDVVNFSVSTHRPWASLLT